MAFRIEILPSAGKQLAKLQKRDRLRVAAAIEGLAQDPRPRGSTMLQGSTERFYRIRAGNYRVIYLIEDDRLIVVVVRVGHRREVYR